jgi:hypothetical protein
MLVTNVSLVLTKPRQWNNTEGDNVIVKVNTIQYNTIQYCYLYSALPGYPAQSAVLHTYQLIIVTSLEQFVKSPSCGNFFG